MSKHISDRRMAENEVIFRAYNERIVQGLEEIKKVAQEDNQEQYVAETDEPLHFYCECSSIDCVERVILKPSEYNKLHKSRDRFVLICGHEIDSIEKIVKRKPTYCVVEKFFQPPVNATVTT